VLVSNAGMAETAADVLLAHLRGYIDPLQLMQGAHSFGALELVVMLQAPLHCVVESPLWCAKC
jgi:hypothetical protein